MLLTQRCLELLLRLILFRFFSNSRDGNNVERRDANSWSSALPFVTSWPGREVDSSYIIIITTVTSGVLLVRHVWKAGGHRLFLSTRDLPITPWHHRGSKDPIDLAPSTTGRNIGVLFNWDLSLNTHIKHVSGPPFSSSTPLKLGTSCPKVMPTD